MSSTPLFGMKAKRALPRSSTVGRCPIAVADISPDRMNAVDLGDIDHLAIVNDRCTESPAQVHATVRGDRTQVEPAEKPRSGLPEPGDGLVDPGLGILSEVAAFLQSLQQLVRRLVAPREKSRRLVRSYADPVHWQPN
jgi:hypothetical protein